MEIERLRQLSQWTMTHTAEVAARVDGSSPATIEFSALLALPDMSCECPHFLREGVINRDTQKPVTVDLPHLSTKVRPMIRSSLQDVILPLMDHLVGQCVEDDLFAAHSIRRHLADQGEGQSDAASIFGRH
jgi:hypothetical protein